MIVYSTVYSDADQRKHQSSASLAFVMGIHRSPVNSPHKGPVTRKIFDDVIVAFMKWPLVCGTNQSDVITNAISKTVTKRVFNCNSFPAKMCFENNILE